MTIAPLLKNPDFADAEAANRSYILSVDFDLAAITPQWRELESSGRLTPFQTQAWLLPWYRIVAPAFGISPVFVTVRDKTSGRPMMLLPLCMRRKRGAIRIEFPDFGLSDYNAPLLAAEFQPSEDEFATLWEDICRALPRADVIILEKMPETIADRPNPMARLAGSSRMRSRAWGVDLPKTRAKYDKSLKSVVRKELRRKRRNLEAEDPVRFLRAQSEAQVREIFEELLRQRQARCMKLSRPDILSNPVFSRFYETVIFDNWTKGFGVLSALTIRDEIAATLFALSHRGHYLLLLHCFDMTRWSGKSPGIVAIDSAITDQIESGGTYFDLTIGNETYKKLQFGARENFLYMCEQGSSPLGLAYVAMRQGRRFVGSQIRRLPKQYWPKRLQA